MLTGIVKDPDGMPVAGVELKVIDSEGRVRRAVTGGSGSYTVRTAPGTCVVFLKQKFRYADKETLRHVATHVPVVCSAG